MQYVDFSANAKFLTCYEAFINLNCKVNTNSTIKFSRTAAKLLGLGILSADLRR